MYLLLCQTAIWRMFASMVGKRRGTERRGVVVLRLRIAVRLRSVRWDWVVSQKLMDLKIVIALLVLN